jgi:N-acetylglucosaminyldiphosphoundecaprenol N-acetyl-beta-D-mannosaminyltransferase
MIPRVDVLGVGVSVVSMETAVAEVVGWIERGERHYICVRDVHGVMESQRDPELLRIHAESGLTLPDGMPMVWAGRFAGAEGIERVYGPDFMLAVCGLAAERGWASFFYGAGQGVPEMLARRLRERFPGLRVAGTHSPPYRPLTKQEDDDVVELINSSGAELIWVGLSTPKQERWMAAHVNRLRAPAVLVGVGAAFDIHAGLKRDAPRWMGPFGLQWSYRLAQEPRRLLRRYGANNPRFIASIIRRPPVLRTPLDAGGETNSRPEVAIYARGKRGVRRWLGSWLAERARGRRHLTYRRLIKPNGDERIIDIGCGPAGLAQLEPDSQITGVDLSERSPNAYAAPHRRYVRADARTLPFEDREFDIAYSNSLIEHLPPRDRVRFAREARRVGTRYFVQTPNRWFPIEPHVLLPFFQHLPLGLRRRLWRFGVFKDPFEDIRLLDAGELERLFPDAIIVRERIGPLTKSLMAVGPRELICGRVRADVQEPSQSLGA